MNNYFSFPAVSAILLTALASCQSLTPSDSDQTAQRTVPIRVSASVQSDRNTFTTTDPSGSSSFAAGDAIGFFMPDTYDLYKWECQGSTWSSATPQYWPDTKNDFTFHAFYPYQEEAVTDKVTMPDLSQQTGLLQDLGQVDFLTAECTCSYSTAAGKVNFTGESAFSHRYAMLFISLSASDAGSSIRLHQAGFSQEGLFSQYTYNLKTEEVNKPAIKESGTLTLAMSTLEPTPEDEGYELAVLTNPNPSTNSIGFEIKYEQDGITYQAKTNLSLSSLEAGKCYRYTIKTEKEQLKVEGFDIIGWVNGNEQGEDIILNGTPVRE